MGGGQAKDVADWMVNALYNVVIIHLSCIHLPGFLTKLSVCKQRGEGGERVVTPPLEGVESSCGRPKTVFIKHASSRGSPITSLKGVALNSQNTR